MTTNTKLHALIAGALYGFAGFLTTSKTRRVFSSADEASPAVEALAEYAHSVGLCMRDADVEGWRAVLASAPAQPVALSDERPACPQPIVDAITAYGDARADQDANGAPTTSPFRLGECIRLIRTALSAQPCSTCNDNGAVGSPPDDYFPCPDCAAPTPSVDADGTYCVSAAIQFALATDEPKAFLRAWLHGDWDVIRREWPEAPGSVFADAPQPPAPSEQRKPLPDDGIARAAAWVRKRRDDYLDQHAEIDPTTGAVEFGRGASGDAKREYVGELDEIIEGIEALGRCDVAPAGWYCSRNKGHEGPCAAHGISDAAMAQGER